MLVGLIGGCRCSGSSHCWFNMRSWLRFSFFCPELLDALGSCSVTSGGLLVFIQGYVGRVCFRSLVDLTLLSAWNLSSGKMSLDHL